MKIFFSRTFAVALVLVLAATGLWAGGATDTEPAAAAEREMVLDPTTGKLVSAPQYGGTFTATRLSDPAGSDAFFGHPTRGANEFVCEQLGNLDWAVDRDEFDLAGAYIPDSARTGRLVESWTFPPTASPLPFTSARALTGMTRRR